MFCWINALCLRAVAKVRREIAGQQALIKQLEMKRSDVMQAAAMDQVRSHGRACGAQTMPALLHSVLTALQTHVSCFCIPIVQQALRCPCVLQIDLPRADGDGAAPMETDDTADGDGDNAAAAAAELDFSRLKRQHLGTHTPAERDKVAAELEGGIEETKAQLERVAPNLKVGLRAGSGGHAQSYGHCTGPGCDVRTHPQSPASCPWRAHRVPAHRSNQYIFMRLPACWHSEPTAVRIAAAGAPHAC